ncbi:hypothetical protein C6T66_12830 [Burkholderia multivorans]|uniref:Uncharacterized protein n=1 Tax=Burkholderia multivorans TaxID=87883 RepID=A0A8E2UTU9_9BURK|nr:hypothetical protein C6P76_02755 [Burkholderia multivorans]PRF20681.1 hypothetical protein C6P98_20930 [Burkholderia multivorans]PRG87020.1 hypothetical protein C6T66_12830 [Burkholderia multivorans]
MDRCRTREGRRGDVRLYTAANRRVCIALYRAAVVTHNIAHARLAGHIADTSQRPNDGYRNPTGRRPRAAAGRTGETPCCPDSGPPPS